MPPDIYVLVSVSKYSSKLVFTVKAVVPVYLPTTNIGCNILPTPGAGIDNVTGTELRVDIAAFRIVCFTVIAISAELGLYHDAERVIIPVVSFNVISVSRPVEDTSPILVVLVFQSIS